MNKKVKKGILMHDLGMNLQRAFNDDDINREEIVEAIEDRVVTADIAHLIDDLLENENIYRAWRRLDDNQ